MRKITIAISGDGKTAVNFDGFDGQDCFSEANQLNALLEKEGVKIDNQKIKVKNGGVVNGQPADNSYVKQELD